MSAEARPGGISTTLLRVTCLEAASLRVCSGSEVFANKPQYWEGLSWETAHKRTQSVDTRVSRHGFYRFRKAIDAGSFQLLLLIYQPCRGPARGPAQPTSDLVTNGNPQNGNPKMTSFACQRTFLQTHTPYPVKYSAHTLDNTHTVKHLRFTRRTLDRVELGNSILHINCISNTQSTIHPLRRPRDTQERNAMERP